MAAFSGRESAADGARGAGGSGRGHWAFETRHCYTKTKPNVYIQNDLCCVWGFLSRAGLTAVSPPIMVASSSARRKLCEAHPDCLFPVSPSSFSNFV